MPIYSVINLLMSLRFLIKSPNLRDLSRKRDAISVRKGVPLIGKKFLIWWYKGRMKNVTV
jgi:hypothetical protein